MIETEARSTDRILKKALDLFSSKGYDATSVREICEAAGITKPTLYHFFGSKEGVYRALVEGALDEFRDGLRRAVGAPGPVGDRLRQVARSYFEYASSSRELTRFMMGLVHNPATSAPKTDFPRFYEGIVALVAQCVDEGVASGELTSGPTDVRMLVFMGALGECVCGSIMTGQPELTPALADCLVQNVMEGWR